MTHPLEQKIGSVRRDARRLVSLYALAQLLAAAIAIVIVAGTLDYFVRYQDYGIRLMATGAVAAMLAWLVYRCWLVGFYHSPDDLQVAERLERLFPQLADRLTSALEFLRQDDTDPRAGSAALRRAVIAETTAEVAPLEFGESLDRRPTRFALAVALAALGVAAVLAVVSPESVRVAVLRLARPLGDDVFPRMYCIEFRNAPRRLAAGQTFEVELVSDDGHRVPRDAMIHYRYGSGPTATEESEPMETLGTAVLARKESVTRPFWYRAEGGDDRSMPWIHLEVVEPPRLESLQVTIHPPAYSGLPVESSEKSIQALRGTVVELRGTATKKLKSATIRQENGPEITATVSADGHQLSLGADSETPLVIDKSGPWWISLVDAEGLEGGADERWEIRAVPDLAPSVVIEQPSANLFVTSHGEVPLKISAKDDFALRDVVLHYNRSDRTDVEDFSIPLYSGSEHAASLDKGLASGAMAGEQRVLENRLQLADLGLPEGARISFWATAGDYLPQEGKSTPRGITIISKRELEERLAQRQTLILNELQRVLKLQQEARSQTRSIETQLDQVGTLTRNDIDAARSAELNQRQVTRTLTSPGEGIAAQITDLLADIESNKLDSPDLERHVRSLGEELSRLGREHLTPIERDMTAGIKAAQAATPPDSPANATGEKADPLVKESFSSVGANQDQVIASLERMTSELGQWDNYRRFARDIAQLEREQKEIHESTSGLGQKTLGRDLKDLDAQTQADLKKLADRQAELSRRLEKSQQQMAQMAASLKATDPLAAATIDDAVHQAQQQAISGQMRQAAGRLEKNQLGQANQQQAKIAKDLDDLLSILSNRREQELARLVKQLRDSEKDLARMRSRQAGLRKQMAAAAKGGDAAEAKRQLERLAREEMQLQDEAARLARRLERLQADTAARTAGGAASKMGQSTAAGQQGDAAGAGDQAEQAQRDLEEAQQQLAERRRQAEEDLAREQMAQLEDSLKSLHERQEKMIGETDRVEKLRSAEGRLSRAQVSTVHELARQQKALERETSALQEKLALAEVIALALDGAMKQMNRAANLLESERTDGAAQSAEEAARARLAQLKAAFENQQKPGGQAGGSRAGGGQEGESRRDGNQVLAQMKLLKLLQEDINTRYRDAAEQEPSNRVAQRDLEEMAAEQGKLAELALKLSEPPKDAPEDDPEKLPDVRKDKPLADKLLEPALEESLK